MLQREARMQGVCFTPRGGGRPHNIARRAPARLMRYRYSSCGHRSPSICAGHFVNASTYSMKVCSGIVYHGKCCLHILSKIQGARPGRRQFVEFCFDVPFAIICYQFASQHLIQILTHVNPRNEQRSANLQYYSGVIGSTQPPWSSGTGALE
ncbi:uncharacterized protein LAJ45_07193 [Morchella importuna]|uniref:uncharacterized protein n=1 Tax=Morchella importuna TaxID=1174673 RepID=UPI001E8CF122|nr:uncharacterized protein LAJ45_07193 [Morchella importuna]KAH8148850.1 hypothetical protein LAJ45_07193 [Morchella importuna]